MNYRMLHCGTANASAGSPEGWLRRGDAVNTPQSTAVDGRQTVLLTGGNGYLGPPVIAEMQDDFTLVASDVEALGWREQPPVEMGGVTLPSSDLPPPHSSIQVDAGDAEQVRAAVSGTDVVVNLAVVRPDRQVAFDVNTRGTYNAIRAAVDNGHSRFINTGQPSKARLPHLATRSPDADRCCQQARTSRTSGTPTRPTRTTSRRKRRSAPASASTS